MSEGKSVRLFLVDGTPGGLVTADIMNWTGHVLAGSRSGLLALLARSEVRRTGVYVLLGEDPDSVGGFRVYVGEGDDVAARLKAHESSRDFWDRVIVMTSKDANLTKAHVRYLESRLIGIANGAKRSAVENGTSPTPPPLPEADVSDMEQYLSQVQIVLPVLGVNVFRSAPVRVAPTGTTLDPSSPVFVAGLGKESWARAEEVDGEFTVRQGSRAVPWKGTDTSYRSLQDKLRADGTLMAVGDQLEFSHDQVFASPSAASAVVLGRNSNGRLEWRVEGTRETYGQWQESLVAKVPTEEES